MPPPLSAGSSWPPCSPWPCSRLPRRWRQTFGVAALDGTFADGGAGWTSTSSCAPLCTVATTVDPGAGAGEPGSATVIYTSLGGLLGGLASGTSTWTSPSFTWTSATPASASLAFARRAAIGGLLSAGGSAGARFQLRDLTSGKLTTIDGGSIAAAETSFVTHVLTVDPALFQQGHAYRLVITTNLAAAALLSNVRVSYDDIALTATVDEQGTAGGTGGGDGTGPGTTGGSGSGSGTPGAKTALHLLVPRAVRFAPGRALTLRVRATRAGKAVGGLAVTLRVGRLLRRLSTGRDGYASIRLTRFDRAPIRITFRAGAAAATTWLRPVSAA